MSSKRKLTTLTYADKLKAIEAMKSGLKRKDVAVQFGIHESTLSLIIKKEVELLKKRESGESLLCKRRKIAEFPILEQYLFMWFKQCRNQNISVSGPIVKEKAQEFANLLKIHNFRGSNGWLENFKKRHDLEFKKMSGESVIVSISVCQKCISELHNLVNDYDPNYVFPCPCDFPSESQEVIKDEDNKTHEEWNKHMSGSNIIFEDSITCKDEVVTTGMLKEEEIFESVSNSIESDKDDDFNDEPHIPFIRVSINEARRAIVTLQSFIEQYSNIKDNVFKTNQKIPDFISAD